MMTEVQKRVPKEVSRIAPSGQVFHSEKFVKQRLVSTETKTKLINQKAVQITWNKNR